MIVVTGASGNVGGEVARALAGAGQPVRALVRDGSAGPAGVGRVVGDLDRPASLSGPLHGARGLFLLGGYRDMPGVLAEAAAAGVEHVVLLSSGSAAGSDDDNAIELMHRRSEDAVRDSGVGWTILRPSGFMSNAVQWRPQLDLGDIVRVQFPDVAVASIDPADIAAVAALALTAPGHSGATYMITGPAALRPAEQVATLARVLDRPLTTVGLTDAETRAELGPGPYSEAFLRFFADGTFDDSVVRPTVAELLGRPARTFDDWAGAHADAFR